MSKISARDIQTFVAGAMALNGFHSLFWAFSYCFYPRDFEQISIQLLYALVLPLGIGIFMGRAWAIRLTVIYYWIIVFSTFTAVPIFCFSNPAMAKTVIWYSAYDLLISIFVLGLISWSRSRRFQMPNTVH
jgi:hypothetical protein